MTGLDAVGEGIENADGKHRRVPKVNPIVGRKAGQCGDDGHETFPYLLRRFLRVGYAIISPRCQVWLEALRCSLDDRPGRYAGLGDDG